MVFPEAKPREKTGKRVGSYSMLFQGVTDLYYTKLYLTVSRSHSASYLATNKLDNALPGTSSWAGRVDNSKCAGTLTSSVDK